MSESGPDTIRSGAGWTTMSKDSSERPIDILLIEDNPGDIRLTRIAFEEARVRNDLHVVQNGGDALDYLRQRGEYSEVPRPDIVLLDLNLPGMSGFDILETVKKDVDLKAIPVIVLTSSDAEEDIVKSYEEHANAFLKKPVDADEFIDLARSLGEFWIQMVELPSVDD